MLFEVDEQDAAARFAEMMATIAAGYGVLIKRGDEVVARLAPEAAFHAAPAGDDEEAVSSEALEAQEMLEAFEAAMNDSF